MVKSNVIRGGYFVIAFTFQLAAFIIYVYQYISKLIMEDVTPDYWVEHHEECIERLNLSWDKIPLINAHRVHTLREGQLVRFRGMVQDMMNPLLYFTKIEAINLKTQKKEMVYGKYKECAYFEDYEELENDVDLMVDQERRPYYCVTTPGLNDWALPAEEPLLSDEPNCSKEVSAVGTDSGEMKDVASKGNDSKRNSEDASFDDTGSSKKQKLKDVEHSDHCLKHYYPIASKNNHSCVVTLYDVKDGELKLNEIIEAVGFLWYSRIVPLDEDEENLTLPPLVPRLHAVDYKKITNCNPFCTPELDCDGLLTDGESLRGDLHLALTQLMLGDSLAADYLICHLISTVYVRQDYLALGKLCVNFSNVPMANGMSTFPEGFYSILSQLVPKSHFLPFSLESMNTLDLLPEKDYEKNRLKSGVLQLSDRTHLVLDETKMQAGRLQEKGVKNISALNDLITYQRLVYNFRYHEMEFMSDIPVVTLSEGKSMLKSDVEVPLETLEACTAPHSIMESLEAVRKYLFKEPMLTKIRQFLSVVSSCAFHIPQELLGEVIENDFVSLRQEPGVKTTVDDLHNLLVLARLVCLSFGKTSMTQAMWRKAFSMELERKTRLAKRNRS